jgi:hypothetical protein
LQGFDLFLDGNYPVVSTFAGAFNQTPRFPKVSHLAHSKEEPACVVPVFSYTS